MAYIPPTPAVMSKMRYYLERNLDSEVFQMVEKCLFLKNINWPQFRLYAKFRETFTNVENEFEDGDIMHLTERETNSYTDIDDALNMLTRLENALKLHIKEKNGVLTTGLQFRFKSDDLWSLTFVRDALLS